MMLSRYSDDQFGVVFGRAVAVIEAQAGRDLEYARRSIDRLLARQINATHECVVTTPYVRPID